MLNRVFSLDLVDPLYLYPCYMSNNLDLHSAKQSTLDSLLSRTTMSISPGQSFQDTFIKTETSPFFNPNLFNINAIPSLSHLSSKD